MTKFVGYLDRLRENLEVLDEQIATARKMTKSKGKDANALQWTKTLRDLIELRNVTIEKIKGHLLGRDETGVPNEPDTIWSENAEVEFERHFQIFLAPWSKEDLKLKCEDCGVESEEVSNHTFTYPYPRDTEYFDLCKKCYDKRTTESNGENQEVGPVAEPASKRDISVILQTAALSIKALRTFPVDQRIAKLEDMLADKFEVAPGMEPAWEAYRDVLQKELNNAKATGH